MLKFKDQKGNFTIRQGGSPGGKILSAVVGGQLFYGIRNDGIGSLADFRGDFTPPQFDRSGHLKVIVNDILWATAAGVPITTATTTTVLSAPSSDIFYRIYLLEVVNNGAAVEIVSWQFRGRLEAAASNKFRRSYGLRDEQIITMLPGYTDCLPGTSVSLITVNGGASVEYTIGYSIMAVEQ